MTFQAILSEQWSSIKGQLNSNIVALGVDGNVYRYSKSKEGWIKLNDMVVDDGGNKADTNVRTPKYKDPRFGPQSKSNDPF